MSTSRRLISGSAASWVQIIITIVSQLALVPVYLSFWDVRTYGIWLAIQALAGILSTVDKGHQYYLYFEFLQLDQNQKTKISLMLGSGIRVAIISGLMQIGLVIIFMITGCLGGLFGEKISISGDNGLLYQSGIVLIWQCVAWLLSGSVSGLFGRVLAVYGYYPRIAWWNVIIAIITSIIPAISVALGAKLVMTGAVYAIATVLFNIPFNIDMVRLLVRENIVFNLFSWKIGFVNFFKSIAVTAKDMLETIRQQGVRIILSPLLGATKLAYFSTMRTGANFFLQGLNTITNPLLPELMRFLNQRDQQKSEAGFGTIWIVLIALLAPGVVLIQAFIGPVYVLWTRGHIPFDPALFSMLSLNVLIYGLGQPAIAVVTGNNLLRAQLIISAVSGVLLIGSIFVLVSFFALRGAGLALMIAESASTIGYQIVAKNWLISHGLAWPKKPYFFAFLSVCIAATSMTLMILIPKFLVLVLAASLLLFGLNAIGYWKLLPEVAVSNAKLIFQKIPVISRMVK